MQTRVTASEFFDAFVEPGQRVDESACARIAEGFAVVVRQVSQLVEHFAPFLESVADFVVQVSTAPEAAGYEPLFKELGRGKLEARVLAYAIRIYGQQLAEEQNYGPSVITEAIKKIAKSRGKTKIVSRQAAKIHNQLGDSPEISAAFAKLGQPVNEDEFRTLIGRAALAEPAACRRLAEIAAELGSHIAARRGPKVSVESAMHEVLLHSLHKSGDGRSYTWRDDENNFTDPATQATRIATGRKDFDPRPAAGRVKRRHSLGPRETLRPRQPS